MDLRSHLFPAKDVQGQPSVGEVTLANGLEETVVDHVSLPSRDGQEVLQCMGLTAGLRSV